MKRLEAMVIDRGDECYVVVRETPRSARKARPWRLMLNENHWKWFRTVAELRSFVGPAKYSYLYARKVGRKAA